MGMMVIAMVILRIVVVAFVRVIVVVAIVGAVIVVASIGVVVIVDGGVSHIIKLSFVIVDFLHKITLYYLVHKSVRYVGGLLQSLRF